MVWVANPAKVRELVFATLATRDDVVYSALGTISETDVADEHIAVFDRLPERSPIRG